MLRPARLLGFVAQIGWRLVFPFPQRDLSYGLCDWYAKGGVTIEHRDPDLKLGNLPVKGPRH